MQKNDNWDDLDFLFNRAKLKNIDVEIAITERISLLSDLRDLLLKNNIDFYLDAPTNKIFESQNKENIFEDKITIKSQTVDTLKNIFTTSSFKIVKLEKNSIYLKKNSRIFILSIQPEGFTKINLHNIPHDENIYKAIKKSSPKKIREFNFKKKIKLLLLNTFCNKLSEKNFLNLEIEAKNSKSWQLRYKHLDLVTELTNNKKVKEIITFFSDQENFSIIKNQIIDTPTEHCFEEPIYANKNFWMTGNNFFIYPIIFMFKKNVVPYKEANKYIEKKKKPNLYSREYYEGLDSMSDQEIKKFLRKNPIEISNNCIVSGKHRAFAMIGRLVSNEKYIPFYVKFI
jgi:hypothetical protein